MNTIKPTLALTIALLLSPFAFAGPKEELLRLVPADSSVVFVIQDIREHSKRLASSPFGKSLEQSDWAKALTSSDEWKMIEGFQKIITEHLGITFEELRDDILGDALVFAYQPGDGKDKRESGVFLLHARDPEKMAKLMKRINDAQTGNGEVLEILEKKEGSERFHVRRKANGNNDAYFIKNNILAFSAQESAMETVLRQYANAKESAFAKSMQSLGFDKAAVACLISTKAIHAELTERTKTANDDNKAFLTQFVKLWTGLDAVGIGVHLDTGIDITISATGDPKKLPKEYAWLFEKPKASQLWQNMPHDSLFAMAGSFELSKVLDFVKHHLSDASKEKLQKFLDNELGPIVGKDMLPKILKTPDVQWGFWITPPSDTKSEQLPAATFALQNLGDIQPVIEQTIQFLFQAFRVNHNKNNEEQLRLGQHPSTGFRQRFEVVCLQNEKVLPAGVLPSYLFLKDSKNEVPTFGGGISSKPTRASVLLSTHFDPLLDFTGLGASQSEDAGLLMRLNCSKLAEYLKGSKVHVTVAKLLKKDEGEIRKEFEGITKIMELFDNWELRHSATGNTASLTLKIKPAKPLK